MKKSPFIVKQDFISPYMCEDIVDSLNFIVPDYDTDNNPISSFKYNEDMESVIFEKLQFEIDNIEEYYDIKYKGTSEIQFGFLPQGYKSKYPISDNSKFINNRWTRINDYDFTGIIFLTDYNDKPSFSNEFEVYGGKLEFKNHNFGFNPQRGTLILFPSNEYFLYKFGDVKVGDMHYIKFKITCNENFKYNRLNFPGDYLTWFESVV